MQLTKQFLIPFLFLFSFTSAYAQLWDAGGDGTRWDDPLNWDGDAVPLPGALVDINMSVNLTLSGSGTANTPAQVKVRGAGVVVSLDMDLTVGDGITSQHAIQMNNGGSLVILSGRTLTINAPATRNGISNFAGNGTDASVIINDGGTLSVIQARRGISMLNATATLTNNGTVSLVGCQLDGVYTNGGATVTNNAMMIITSPVGDGIDNSGVFVNTHTLTITDAGSRGIDHLAGASFTNTGSGTILITNSALGTTSDGIRSADDFLNDTTAVITITETNDDGIELIGGTFTNHGTINLTADPFATANNVALAVGTATASATFVNTSNNSLNADGGTSGSARAVYVYASGVLENTGTMDVRGGNLNQAFYIQGTATNGIGGTINMNTARANNNSGIFLNEGLITSSYAGGPGFFTGTGAFISTNNAFFQYANSGQFSSGTGPVTDDGIDINDPAQITIDFGGPTECQAPFIPAIYEWEYFGNPAAIGIPGSILMLLNDGVSTDPAVITAPLLPAVSIIIMNFCLDALPIELLDIKAIAMEKSVLIKWQTATETNNDYMAVEHSADGETFREIGRKQGAGNSNTSISYELEDLRPVKGVNYYRLRQVDFDGSVNYSPIVSAVFSGDQQQGQPSIYPNLVKSGSQFNIDLRTFEPGQLLDFQIIDINGRSWSAFALPTGSINEMQLPELPAGTYLLVNREAQSKPIRFVVNR